MPIVEKHLEQIFTTPLFFSKLDDNDMIDNLVNYILEDQKNDGGVKHKHHWKTDDDLHLRPQFRELVEMLEFEIEEVMDIYGIVRERMYINNMWAQVSDELAYHDYHIHPNSYWSGILYLNTPEHSGNTHFFNVAKNNNLIRPQITEFNQMNTEVWVTEPERGKLVMFPSWLPHSVNSSNEGCKFNNNQKRVTLAFTAMFKGEVDIVSAKFRNV